RSRNGGPERERASWTVRRSGQTVRGGGGPVQRDRGIEARRRCAGLFPGPRSVRRRRGGGVGARRLRASAGGPKTGGGWSVRCRGVPGRGDPGGDSALRLRGR